MNPQPSKQFRWVGQPSEEELLGIPVSATRHRDRGSVRVAPAPPPRRVVVGPAPARPLHARDAITVLAGAAVVWLVLGGTGAGFRFSGSTPLAPEATAPARSHVVRDRAELRSLPRTEPSPARDRGARTATGGGPEDRGSKAGGKNDPAPPGDGDGGGGGGGGGTTPHEPPLVQANLPVVGEVTVDKPDLPAPETPGLPEVPDVPPPADVLPETELPLP